MLLREAFALAESGFDKDGVKETSKGKFANQWKGGFKTREEAAAHHRKTREKHKNTSVPLTALKPGVTEGRVLPDLTAKEPKPEHSKQYKDRDAAEAEKKRKASGSAEMRRFLKNPSFGRNWRGPK